MQIQHAIKEEQVEILVVVVPNAIVDPRAMMIHFENA
jgi:hypothetical protein